MPQQRDQVVFRLSKQLLARLDRVAHNTDRTRSELLREAVEQFVDRAETRTATGASRAAEPARPIAGGSSDGVPTYEVTAAAAGGGAFDFWASELEDVYLTTDGEPLE